MTQKPEPPKTGYAGLTASRWAEFSIDDQILMIACEMQRGLSAMRPERARLRRLTYEWVLQLVDLTLEVQSRPELRRELGLWRGVITELQLRDEPDRATHELALKVLLQTTPEAAKQVALLGL